MARELGTFNFSANFEVKKAGTLDARCLVDNFEDLLNFTSDNYIRNGFIVAVANTTIYNSTQYERGFYQCIDSNNLDLEASWEFKGGSGNSSNLSVNNSNFSVLESTNAQDVFEEIDTALFKTRNTGISEIIGELTDNGTTVTTPSVIGGIVDVENGIYKAIDYTGETGITPLVSDGGTYYYLDLNTVTLQKSTVQLTQEQQRTNLYLGYSLSIGGSIVLSATQINPVTQTSNSLKQLSDTIGKISINPAIMSGTANNDLTLAITSGSYYSKGSNFNNLNDPDSFITPLFDQSNGDLIRNRSIAGFLTDTATIDVGFYQDGSGVRTAIPGSDTRASNFYIFVSNSLTFYSVYSREWFDTVEDASSALSSTEARLASGGFGRDLFTLIGAISVEKGETNLNNAIFTPTNLFANFEGTTGSTGGGGNVVWGQITGTLSNQTDLQNALNSKLKSGDNISVLNNDVGYITDYTVTEADVTQYESALTITESQISDLNHFSGDYNDLTNLPTINNDVDYISNVELTGTDLIFSNIGNAFTGTIDLSSLGGGSSYTDEEAQDAVASAFTAGTQTRISIGYDDANNLFNFTVDNDLSSYDNTITQFISLGDNISELNNDIGYLTSVDFGGLTGIYSDNTSLNNAIQLRTPQRINTACPAEIDTTLSYYASYNLVQNAVNAFTLESGALPLFQRSFTFNGNGTLSRPTITGAIEQADRSEPIGDYVNNIDYTIIVWDGEGQVNWLMVRKTT